MDAVQRGDIPEGRQTDLTDQGQEHSIAGVLRNLRKRPRRPNEEVSPVGA